MAIIRIFRCNLIGSQTGIGQRDLVNPPPPPQMPAQGTQAYLDSWEDQDGRSPFRVCRNCPRVVRYFIGGSTF